MLKVLIFAFCSQASGQEMFGFASERIVSPTASAEHQFVSGITEEKIGFSAPIHKSETQQIDVLVKGQRTDLNRKLIFADRNVVAPEEFGSAEIGLSGKKSLDEGQKLGWAFAYGSSGT